MVDNKTMAIVVFVMGISALGWGMYLKADYEVKVLNYELGIIDESLINMNLKYSELEGNYSQLEREFGELLDEASSKDAKISDLENDIDAIEYERGLLETSLENKTLTIELLSEEVYNLEGEIEELNEQLSSRPRIIFHQELVRIIDEFVISLTMVEGNEIKMLFESSKPVQVKVVDPDKDICFIDQKEGSFVLDIVSEQDGIYEVIFKRTFDVPDVSIIGILMRGGEISWKMGLLIVI